ncbi:hypothetical protein [Haladaptatus sp.]|uniref:hypothetical protein n=1 Tax=Haladaptatus sp. TaxID=1973141 RepID=UPI003C57A6D4
MKYLSRRAVLGGASSSLIAGAGCLSPSKSEPKSKINFISIKNKRNHAVDVHLRVKDASKIVLEETHHLETYSGMSPKSSVYYTERPVKHSGRYVVTVSVDDTPVTVDTTTQVHGKADCVGIIFRIEPGSGLYYESKAVQHC